MVAVTAGSPAKLDLCGELGADLVISHRDQDFVEQVRAATDGRGADVILDIMGATYLDRNLQALAVDGRLVIIGMQGGVKAELKIGTLIAKRLQVIGTALRSRPVGGPHSKSDIVAATVNSVWPLIEAGAVRPIIGARFPIQQAGEAHRVLAAGETFGKILLSVSD
jgi:NADPH:quinone reductase-like Zn-dependent oxidoreductase